jgi:HEAT repeat protein
MSTKYAINQNTARKNALTIFSIALAVMLIVIASTGNSVNAQKLASRNEPNRLVKQGGNDAASVMFRGGRDLITDEQWAKAEEKFGQYVAGFPKDKDVDAALYWMAYSQYKQKQYDKCKSTVDRLLKDYEKTTWKEDARVLVAQIPGGNGIGFGTGFGVGSGNTAPAVARVMTPEAAAEREYAVAAKTSTLLAQQFAPMPAVRNLRDEDWNIDNDKGSDDDPCEFKIVVLQALFQSDVQRGITAATEWLTPASTQTARCKGAALTLLARHGGKGVTPVILGIAKNEPDLKLRARAISALGTTNDDTVIDPLRDFALNSQDSTIAEAALYALGQHNGPRAVIVLTEIGMSGRATNLRRIAIASIASRPGDPAVDALFKIYDADQNIEIRKVVIAGFGHRKSERAGAKLLEIARGSDNIELRKAAIGGIASRSGEGALGILLNIYDTEKTDELKDRILNSIGNSSDPRVTDKLIQIAKDPQTPMERRRRAIGYLSRSKDPKVSAFLEDLLKK